MQVQTGSSEETKLIFEPTNCQKTIQYQISLLYIQGGP